MALAEGFRENRAWQTDRLKLLFCMRLSTVFMPVRKNRLVGSRLNRTGVLRMPPGYDSAMEPLMT